jgi:hypothetical protein
MLTSTARKSLPSLSRSGRRLDQAVEHQPAQHRAAVVAERHQHRLAAPTAIQPDRALARP